MKLERIVSRNKVDIYSLNSGDIFTMTDRDNAAKYIYYKLPKEAGNFYVYIDCLAITMLGSTDCMKIIDRDMSVWTVEEEKKCLFDMKPYQIFEHSSDGTPIKYLSIALMARSI